MHTDTPRNTDLFHRVLRLPGVCHESGQARSTIYRRISEGLWPQPVKLGPRAVGWPASEVAALNGARIAGKSDDEIRALVAKLQAARAVLGGGL